MLFPIIFYEGEENSLQWKAKDGIIDLVFCLTF